MHRIIAKKKEINLELYKTSVITFFIVAVSEVFIRALTTKDKNEKRQSYWIIIFLWFAKNKTWCITEISLNLVIPKNYTSQSELTKTMILLSFIGFQNFAHKTKDERISFSQKAKEWGNVRRPGFSFLLFFSFFFFRKWD